MTAITALASNVQTREAKYKVTLISDSDKEVPIIAFSLQKKTFNEWLLRFKSKVNKTKGTTMEFCGAIVFDVNHNGNSVTLHTA